MTTAMPDLPAMMERPQSRPDFVDPGDLEAHPLADLFPAMATDDLEALVNDIAERGLMQPIVLYEGKILDGRNRYWACRWIPRAAAFAEYTGNDPVGYVVAVNVHRRHLTASQKAVLARAVEEEYAKAAKVRQVEGGRVSQDRETLSDPDPIHAAKKAAEVVGVSHSYISDAKKVAAADPELLEEVRTGEKTLPAAVKQIKDRDVANLPVRAVRRAKPKRGPLVLDASKAGPQLRKLAERLVRIREDDRFRANRPQIAAALIGDLDYTIKVCNDIRSQLAEESSW